jgi:hypothetical protein
MSNLIIFRERGNGKSREVKPSTKEGPLYKRDVIYGKKRGGEEENAQLSKLSSAEKAV